MRSSYLCDTRNTIDSSVISACVEFLEHMWLSTQEHTGYCPLSYSQAYDSWVDSILDHLFDIEERQLAFHLGNVPAMRLCFG